MWRNLPKDINDCLVDWWYLTPLSTIFQLLWRSVLLVEETGGPGENHWSVPSHCQTLSHNVVHLALIEIRTHNISCDRHWLHGYELIYEFNHLVVLHRRQPMADHASILSTSCVTSGTPHNRQTSGESASLPQYLGCNTVFDMRLRFTFLRRKTVSLQSNIAHRE